MTTPAPLTRSLFTLSIFYGGMVCIAGVLGNKQVALGPLAVEAGIFAFLLLVAVSLVDLSAWRRLLRMDRGEFGVAAATLMMVVGYALPWALMLGGIVLMWRFVRRFLRQNAAPETAPMPE